MATILATNPVSVTFPKAACRTVIVLSDVKSHAQSPFLSGIPFSGDRLPIYDDVCVSVAEPAGAEQKDISPDSVLRKVVTCGLPEPLPSAASSSLLRQ